MWKKQITFVRLNALNSFASLVMAKISRVGTMQEVISLLIGKTMKRKNDKSEKKNGSLGDF